MLAANFGSTLPASRASSRSHSGLVSTLASLTGLINCNLSSLAVDCPSTTVLLRFNLADGLSVTGMSNFAGTAGVDKVFDLFRIPFGMFAGLGVGFWAMPDSRLDNFPNLSDAKNSSFEPKAI